MGLFAGNLLAAWYVASYRCSCTLVPQKLHLAGARVVRDSVCVRTRVTRTLGAGFTVGSSGRREVNTNACAPLAPSPGCAHL